MIISDLQHIESVTETAVQGGCRRCDDWRPPGVKRNPYNTAEAEAEAQAFGTNTITSTTTDTLVIQGQFSGSGSSSFAETF
jgi:hypothetical protein